MALDIFFNGNPLQTEEIIIERFEERSSPPKDILDLELAHKDGSRVVNITEKPKVIRMVGSLITPTISGFLGLTDEFKKILSEQEKKLKIIDHKVMSLDTDHDIGSATGNIDANTWHAQGITPKWSGNGFDFSFWIRDNNNTSNAFIHLRPDNADEPTSGASQDIESFTLDKDDFGDSFTKVTLNFNAALTAGIKYWIVVATGGTGDWDVETESTGTYSGGAMSVSPDGGLAWTTGSDDMQFQLSVNKAETREWTASVLGEIKIPHEHWSTTYSPFEVSMYAADPYAKDTGFTTFSGTSLSGLFQDTVVTFSGTKEPLPIIDYAITTLGGITGISLTNQVNNQTIIVSTAYNNGDVLSFDTAQVKTFLNNSEIIYSGMFPDFALGSNTIRSSFTTTGTQLIDQSQEDRNTLWGVIGNTWAATSFQPAITGERPKTSVLIAGHIAVTNNITVEIQGDSAGDPDGVAIGSIATVQAGSISNSFSWVDFDYGTFPSLTSGVTYWIVYKASDVPGQDPSDGFYSIGYQSGTNPYANGEFKTSLNAGATWQVPLNSDGTFRDYVSEAPPSHTFNQTISYKRRWR